MIPLVIGLTNLTIGLTYAGLGLLSAWETISLHRYRGWSRFGIGFSLMAASCGPHHLVHGWHVLQGESVSGSMLVATLIGLPAGLTFLFLRFETMFGGHGERPIAASPHRAILLVGTFAALGGWLAAWTMAQPNAFVPFLCTSAEATTSVYSVTFLANLFVTVTYSMVGWYLADHQVRRYLTAGVWSLSGVSLTGVFFSCALIHLIDAMTYGNGAVVVFDLLGIPASVYFLWVVQSLHSDSVMDWNRRPLVGAAAAPARPSPWSGGNVHR